MEYQERETTYGRMKVTIRSPKQYQEREYDNGNVIVRAPINQTPLSYEDHFPTTNRKRTKSNFFFAFLGLLSFFGFFKR